SRQAPGQPTTAGTPAANAPARAATICSRRVRRCSEFSGCNLCSSRIHAGVLLSDESYGRRGRGRLTLLNGGSVQHGLESPRSYDERVTPLVASTAWRSLARLCSGVSPDVSTVTS